MLLNKLLGQKNDECIKESEFGTSDENLKHIDDSNSHEEVPMDTPLGNMIMIIDASQEEKPDAGSEHNKFIRLECGYKFFHKIGRLPCSNFMLND